MICFPSDFPLMKPGQSLTRSRRSAGADADVKYCTYYMLITHQLQQPRGESQQQRLRLLSITNLREQLVWDQLVCPSPTPPRETAPGVPGGKPSGLSVRAPVLRSAGLQSEPG